MFVHVLHHVVGFFVYFEHRHHTSTRDCHGPSRATAAASLLQATDVAPHGLPLIPLAPHEGGEVMMSLLTGIGSRCVRLIPLVVDLADEPEPVRTAHNKHQGCFSGCLLHSVGWWDRLCTTVDGISGF